MSLPVPFDHSHFLLGYTSVNRSGVKFPKFLSSKFFLSYHYFRKIFPILDSSHISLHPEDIFGVVVLHNWKD